MKKNFFCPLCKIKQKKLLKVAPFVYGDKSKKKAFFLCKNCDVRYLFPRLSKKETMNKKIIAVIYLTDEYIHPMSP